jgi:hypothetical protein
MDFVTQNDNTAKQRNEGKQLPGERRLRFSWGIPIKNNVSWDVTPYSLAESVQLLERAHNFHLQEKNVKTHSIQLKYSGFK